MKEKITAIISALIIIMLVIRISENNKAKNKLILSENKNMILKAEISVLKETIENIAHCDKAEYCREEIEMALDLIKDKK